MKIAPIKVKVTPINPKVYAAKSKTPPLNQEFSPIPTPNFTQTQGVRQLINTLTSPTPRISYFQLYL